MLIAIDPGRNAGWAAIDGSTLHLVGCGLVRDDGRSDTDRGLALARGIREALVARSLPVDGLAIVVERMAAYGASDPNDLIGVTLSSGIAAGNLATDKVEAVPARAWKGNAPKSITQRRTAALLTDAERALVGHELGGEPKSLHHNVWDAIGIAMYAIRRGR